MNEYRMMKRRLLFLAGVLLLPFVVHAQWRIGVNAGTSYNHPVIDRQYMADVQYKDRWGVTLGVMGQYDVSEWLAVRAELDWTQKNWRQTRAVQKSMRYDYTDNYLQLPVMASLSFGGSKVRGFCNAGVYGGYWLNSGRKGYDTNSFGGRAYNFSEDIALDSKRDQRLDFGLLGGAGVEYRFHRRWAAQVEVRYYYSCVSTRKDYMRVDDPRYNSTLALQAGVWYRF